MFIVNPLAALQGTRRPGSLFSTHPPTEERVARLQALKVRSQPGPTAAQDGPPPL